LGLAHSFGPPIITIFPVLIIVPMPTIGASNAGVVVYAGWNNYGYGNMIMVDHGNDFQSLYAHLSGISVQCGQSVGQGDGIGTIGNTGRSTGSHLHFEIRAISSWVNPWDVLP
jgi:murein DD-endopeptidase MepM/ murein hydrolase activator NlpD